MKFRKKCVKNKFCFLHVFFVFSISQTKSLVKRTKKLFIKSFLFLVFSLYETTIKYLKKISNWSLLVFVHKETAIWSRFCSQKGKGKGEIENFLALRRFNSVKNHNCEVLDLEDLLLNNIPKQLQSQN